MRRLFPLLFSLLAVPALPTPELWVYTPVNLLVTEQADRLIALLQRAAKAGYTKALITDSKFTRLPEMRGPDFPRYFPNLRRVKEAAAAAGVELVPALFSVGYSNDLLHSNPNLIEGPPVRDALFEVRGGVARVKPEHPQPLLKGGDFADLRQWGWHDEMVARDEGGIVMTDPRGRNARISQKIAVKPWRQYHLSVWVKTLDFAGTPEFKALSPTGGRSLNWANLGVERTQDWREHHAVFNSLDNETVQVYLGAWGAGAGRLWFRDARLEETALVNLVRRPGAPFTVRTEAGEALSEGRNFEPVSDPLCGTRPYGGCYDVWHEPPVIRMKGDWPDGTRLRVSFHHGITVYDGQAMMDIAEPEAMAILRDQAREVTAAFGAKAYWMSHDEIRVLGWSEAFRRRGLTPGQLLAENARACVKLIHEFAPGARVYVWNDMFDPHHNAVKGPYYLVNGSYEGSWEGLDPSVVIGNWHHGERDKSLRFFRERGHAQVIAGYYDGPLRQAEEWVASARAAGGVEGVMYTTWRNDYAQLEAFADTVRRAWNLPP